MGFFAKLLGKGWGWCCRMVKGTKETAKVATGAATETVKGAEAAADVTKPVVINKLTVKQPISPVKVGAGATVVAGGAVAVHHGNKTLGIFQEKIEDFMKSKQTGTGIISGLLAGFGTIALMQKMMIKPEEKGIWAETKRWLIAPVIGGITGLLTLGAVNSWLEKKIEERAENRNTPPAPDSLCPPAESKQETDLSGKNTNAAAKGLNTTNKQWDSGTFTQQNGNSK